MKRYTLEIIIEEGSDEWWEEITNNELSGCDEVRKSIKNAIWDVGFQEAKVNLIKFEDTSENLP